MYKAALLRSRPCLQLLFITPGSKQGFLAVTHHVKSVRNLSSAICLSQTGRGAIQPNGQFDLNDQMKRKSRCRTTRGNRIIPASGATNQTNPPVRFFGLSRPGADIGFQQPRPLLGQTPTSSTSICAIRADTKQIIINTTCK
jgi:hypothetical protein